MSVTPAHDQRTTVHLLCHVPEHEPRTEDPHYKSFEAMKRRMKAQGLLVCAIKGCTFPGPIEVHHQAVEFSLQGGVDLDKFNELHGLHLDDDAFREWVEGPGNAEPLCPVHHRTRLGVHEMPEPFWNILRVWRDDIAPPAEVETGR